jgi:endo-1,4-beta-xylanase
MLKSKITKTIIKFIIPIFILSSMSTFKVHAEETKPTETKFLGNVFDNTAPSDFSNYWNQVTPENGTKWGSVEQTQDTMSWNWADKAYNYAKANNFPFKFHTLVWGSQQPKWINSLSSADQKGEVEEWIQAAGERYPDSDFVDVVNEPLHAKPTYKDAIGGDGTTGWDWIIWSFEQARKAFPNSKLLINEYGIIGNPAAAKQYVQIVNILKERGLVDGIGIQCHQFNIDTAPVKTMKNVLDILDTTGLPIYVSELDITGDDATQLARYKEKFPVLWEHESVKGVTLWGYTQGKTWKDSTHLVTTTGEERPALKWLKQYVSGLPDTEAPTAPTNITSTSKTSNSISLSWKASTDNVGIGSYDIYNGDKLVGSTSSTNYTVTGLNPSTDYSFTIKAKDMSGNVSPDSDVFTATTADSSVAPLSDVVVTYSVNSWGDGGTVNVTIKNTGKTDINGWTLDWTLPGNQSLASLWCGNYTTSGNSVSVKDAGWNGHIAANGGTASFGFNINFNGSTDKPTSFTLNGANCQVQ